MIYILKQFLSSKGFLVALRRTAIIVGFTLMPLVPVLLGRLYSWVIWHKLTDTHVEEGLLGFGVFFTVIAVGAFCIHVSDPYARTERW